MEKHILKKKEEGNVRAEVTNYGGEVQNTQLYEIQRVQCHTKNKSKSKIPGGREVDD